MDEWQNGAHDSLLEALNAIREEQGMDVLLNAERLRGFLLDRMLNKHSRECDFVLQVLREGAPFKICVEGGMSGTDFAMWSAYIAGKYGVSEDAARGAIICWQALLGRDTPQIGESKTTSGKVDPHTVEILRQNFTNAGVGNHVLFGSYPQKDSNHPEPIEWVVLARDEHEAEPAYLLLLSLYGLEFMSYDTDPVTISWKCSSLRKWLNEDFYCSAFNANEQTMIVEAYLQEPNPTPYTTLPCNTAKDRVFLLSSEEIYICCNSNIEKICRPTRYAATKNSKNSLRTLMFPLWSPGACSWWLRSPGNNGRAMLVDRNGERYFSGDTVDKKYAVRPAIWISLTSV